MIGPFLLSISVFVLSLLKIPLLFLFTGSVRQIKLAIRQVLGARKYIVGTPLTLPLIDGRLS